jgi:type III pantothenate kinase
MNLCIDWGNTRVKAALFQDDKLIEEHNFSHEEALTQIISLADKQPLTAAMICSVSNHPEELKTLLLERCRVVTLDSNTVLPIINAYHSPDTLGADRVALVTAANHFKPDENNLVISIGTAITYNFILKNRAFRGGAISPGINLRLRALHEFTDKLPLVTREGDAMLLGYDTASSIRSGVMNGIAAEIDGMIQQFRDQFQTLNVFLTGGDAPLFAGKLKNQIFADSQLLLKGLNLILKNNVR